MIVNESRYNELVDRDRIFVWLLDAPLRCPFISVLFPSFIKIVIKAVSA